MPTKSKGVKKATEGLIRQRRPRSGAYSRNKGHSFERQVAAMFRPFYPNVGRQLEYQADECKGVDLKNTGEYLIQCKALKKYVSLNTIEEIQVCPIEAGIPLLVTKGDHKRPIAALYLDDFLKLLKAAQR